MGMIERSTKAVAATAALGVNVVLVASLVLLAQHYEREALQIAVGEANVITAAVAAPGALRCRPEAARTG